MLAQNQSAATATMAASVTSQKLLQLLRKRLRQLVRFTLVLAVGLALGAGAFAIWWLTSLNGLPDFGDPFDVAAFRAHSVPEKQNAFTFLRRADESLTSFPSNAAVSWSQASPKLRRWAQANRQALDLFQRGAEQSDAAHPPGNPMVNGTRVTGLALLEGSKRQESGDTSGAWNCYRAVLRMTAHIRRRGSLHQRFDVNTYWSGWLRQRLATWAADPRTTIGQLRTALEAVQESEPRAEWDAFALKGGYLEIMRSLEQPVSPMILQDIGWEYTGRVDDMQLSPDMINYVDGAATIPLARARAQPAGPAIALCQLVGARGNAPEEPTKTGRSGFVLCVDIDEPGQDGHDQRRALSHQFRCSGWSSVDFPARAGRLVGQDRRRQATDPGGKQLWLALATRSTHRAQGTPRPGHHAG